MRIVVEVRGFENFWFTVYSLKDQGKNVAIESRKFGARGRRNIMPRGNFPMCKFMLVSNWS